MNKTVHEKRLLLEQIAHMYYIQGLSQDEIANNFSMSRANISKLLKKCVSDKIIEFKINYLESPGTAISNALEVKFGLKKAIIVPSDTQDEIQKNNVGKASALYLENAVESGMLIGVSWGTTLFHVANNLHPKSNMRVDVIQMVGGMSAKSIDTDGQDLSKKIAAAFNGKSYIMQVPMIVQSRILKELLMDEPNVAEHFKMFDRIDIAVIGLGSNRAELSAVYKSGNISREETENISKLGAVGNLCGRDIDINGNPCITSVSDKIIGIELQQLKKINTVIGVAAGFEKMEAVLGSLRGGYLNVLIVDECLANGILNTSL
jgi:DNA-binding transcriptional regulator LsrR (DeoR family)